MTFTDIITNLNKIKPSHPKHPCKATISPLTRINDTDPVVPVVVTFRSFKNKSTDKTITSKRRCDFNRYKRDVWELTENVKHLIPGIDKRGWKTYHIDHKIPIYYGFKKGIPASVIADVGNLRMLPYRINLSKGASFCPDKDGDLSVMRHHRFGLIVVR